MSDITDPAAAVRIVFAANGWVGVGDNGKGDDFVYVFNGGEFSMPGLMKLIRVLMSMMCEKSYV